jgi:hypothetical protein
VAAKSSIYTSTGDVSGATDYTSTGELVIATTTGTAPSSSSSSASSVIGAGSEQWIAAALCAGLGALLAPENGRIAGVAIGAVAGWFLGGVVALANDLIPETDG